MESRPRYKFYLDETLLVVEPKGWEDIRYFQKYDRELNGLLFFIDATFYFYKDGYDILYNKLYSEGFCAESMFKIMESCADGNYRKVYEGVIKLSKIEINEKICEIKVKPDDNSYYAKIDKSRKQKALLFVGRSKNDVEIEPARIDKGAFFDPAAAAGVYYPILAGVGQEYSGSVITIYEAFRFLIAFMTDGDVEFDSVLFGPGGTQEGMVLTSGLVLFTTQTGLSEAAFKDEFPEISFDELFKEIHKEFDIGFYIDYSGLKPKLFIEREQDIPNGVDIVTLDGVYEIKTKIAEDRLYNIIKLGSSETLDVVSLAFPESIDFLGFKEEQYNVLGNCSGDKELDLVNDWIISSNRIEDAVVTPSDADVDKIFLIDTTFGAGIYAAKKFNNLTPPGPPFFYNQKLINSEKISRFLGAVPSSIAKYLGPARDDTFRAEKTINQPAVSVTSLFIPFQDDFTPPNFDSNNNYDVATSRYTCPVSGIYSFELGLEAGYITTSGDFYIEVRDSTFATIKNQLALNVPVSPQSTNQIIRTGTVNLTFGDKVAIRWISNVSGVVLVIAGSYFSCVASKTGGGVYDTFDPKEYFGLVHEFEYRITKGQFDKIRNNPRGNIVFGQANQNLRRAGILDIQFNPDGNSQVKLITTINNSQ